jgi:O-antigen biosynthesis protein WbqP
MALNIRFSIVVSIRALDIVLSLIGLIIATPVFLILICFGLMDTGSPFFKQIRVGKAERPFLLIKFRTMSLDSESVATHLIEPSKITQLGAFLRRYKLDELPQLWNVLKGDMSMVGPRPCLFNQKQIIYERVIRNIFDVRPGITGLAQIQGIDMSTPKDLAETDLKMLTTLNIGLYFKIILLTLWGFGRGDCIRGS